MIISSVEETAGPPRPARPRAARPPQGRAADDIGDSTLAQGLVFLYKNLDLGPPMPTDHKQLRRPNQYVETIIYESTDSSDSDVSPDHSREDLGRVREAAGDINDYLKGITSTMNTLCSKFGNTELMPSYMALGNLSYHTEMNMFNNVESFFPASLLDYVLHRRSETYTDVYMENVIRHVKRTIEHLKKISNGDYLTERAKEKWRQVEISFNKASILAPTPSAPRDSDRPPQILPKLDIVVRSELDMKTLTRIIEKKIIVEIPEIICKSFKNFRISNKKILFPMSTCLMKLNKSNILLPGSKTLQALPMPPTEVPNPDHEADVEINNHKDDEDTNFIDHQEEEEANFIDHQEEEEANFIDHQEEEETNFIDHQEEETNFVINEEDFKVTEDSPGRTVSFELKSNKTESKELVVITDSSVFDTESENFLDVVSVQSEDYRRKKIIADQFSEVDALARDMRLQMRRLLDSVLPGPAPPAALRTNSLARLTIKSPYENKSYILEEKKRKKLLEIRVKKERLKLAMAESSKVTKHKFVKGGVTPQATNSVTKLSITNKSFYKSIYGENDDTAHCIKIKDLHKHYKNKSDTKSEQSDKENMDSPTATPICMNSDYDLETQVRFFPASPTSPLSPAASAPDPESPAAPAPAPAPAPDPAPVPARPAPSNEDFNSQLKIFSEILTTSYNNSQGDSVEEAERSSLELSPHGAGVKVARATSPEYMAPVDAPPNSPRPPAPRRRRPPRHDPNRLINTPLECRKNIDKIYDLIKCKLNPLNDEKDQSDKISDEESNAAYSHCEKEDGIKNKCHVAVSVMKLQVDRISPLPKIKMVSVDGKKTPFRDIMNSSITIGRGADAKAGEKSVTSTISGISSSKSGESPKYKNSIHDVVVKDKLKTDKEKRQVQINVKTTTNDPLKTISKLITDLDNVKRGNKLAKVRRPDPASPPRLEPPKKNIYSVRTESPRAKIAASDKSDKISPKRRVGYETKPKDKKVDKIVISKIKDILDERAEAQGEAVRGPAGAGAAGAGAAGAGAAPARPGSRLDALAQPKRLYVQAHGAELRTKHGRSLMSERVQRLAARDPRADPRTDGREPRDPRSLHRPAQQRPAMWENKNGNTRIAPSTVSSVVIDQPPIKIGPKLLAEMQRNLHSDKDKNHTTRQESKEEKDLPKSASTLSNMSIVPRDPSLPTQRGSPVVTSTQLGHELHHIVSSIISSASKKPRLSESLRYKKGDLERNSSLHKLDESYLEYSSTSLFSVEVFNDNVKKHVLPEANVLHTMAAKQTRDPSRAMFNDLRLTPSASLQLLLMSHRAPALAASRSLHLDLATDLQAFTNNMWSVSNASLNDSLNYALCQLNRQRSIKAVPIQTPQLINVSSMETPMASKGSQCYVCGLTGRVDQATQLVIGDLNGDKSSCNETNYLSSLKTDANEMEGHEVEGKSDNDLKCYDRKDNMANDSANSLDILVNLLNEIHSITTSQSNISGLKPRQGIVNPDKTSSNKKIFEVATCQTSSKLTATDPDKIMKDAEVLVIFNHATFPHTFHTCKHSRSNLVSVDKQIGVDFRSELPERHNETSSTCLKNRETCASGNSEVVAKGNPPPAMSHAESVMKIKRDVLVTVYSILALTVFAMLSVPQIIV